MSNDSASNIPSPTETQASTSRETCARMCQETPNCNETPNYQEEPNCQEARIYQESPNCLTTSHQLFEVSPDADSPFTMSEEEQEKASCEMVKETLRGMLQEDPVEMSQRCTPCAADYATPEGYEGVFIEL